MLPVPADVFDMMQYHVYMMFCKVHAVPCLLQSFTNAVGYPASSLLRAVEVNTLLNMGPHDQADISIGVGGMVDACL